MSDADITAVVYFFLGAVAGVCIWGGWESSKLSKRIGNLEKRVSKLEDKFEYPYLKLDGSRFEGYIKNLIRWSKSSDVRDMRHKLVWLAAVLGYEWERAGMGKWVKVAKRK